ADSYDHRYIFPVAALLGFVVLAGAYFIMKNIFYAQGVVSILIEVIGGTDFLFVILRKGRLGSRSATSPSTNPATSPSVRSTWRSPVEGTPGQTDPNAPGRPRCPPWSAG